MVNHQMYKTLNFMLRNTRLCKMTKICQVQNRRCSQSTPLARQLAAKIKVTGPLTVADYMKEVLVNPASGYYTQQESIGAQGDFVTSPELSQLFGEMLGVWFLNEWQKVGAPRPMNLIELGPGKGTLMEDILRVFSQLGQLEGVSVHLVELSPKLQDMQAKRLCSQLSVNNASDNLCFASGVTHVGCPIFWHHGISEVPENAFSCVLAHEFFDALPIHKLQKSNAGWREVLIDTDPVAKDEAIFRYIISRSPTPACKLFSPKVDVSRDHIEVCPEAGALMQTLAKRFEEDGGFLLMADYGHDGTKGDTFRGFSRHKLHEPLLNPGSADLTADVDFSFLRQCVAEKALTFGPVTQGDFLSRMGIHLRLKMLLDNPGLSESAKTNLKQGVEQLTHPSQMGERFKFFTMFPQVLEKHLQRFPVAGFVGE